MGLFELKGKVVAITGSGSGIGRAIANVFAKQGALVNVLDFNEEGGRAAATEIGGTFWKVNVSDQAEVKTVIASIFQKHSHLDILINSAGIAQIGNLETTSDTDIDTIYQVNIKGTYNAMHAAVPFMKKQKQGVILNIASVAGTVGIPDRFAYSMSKGAVMSMTLSVAKDFIKDGIRCNSISPGRVHTPFVDGFIKANYPGKEQEMFEKLSKTQPIGRMATPDEIAYLALYLCSDEASFITGTDYPIDGGFIKLNN
ncbi:MAG TPA: SDR family oxidoreductase [Cyclobacteriaceae bacterium]|nr:SDR family oxidoreductase [Cyclobacteriaceae bacterium]